MKMGVIENGTLGVVPATQDISSTESDDSAEDVSTSVFMETNPLLEDEKQTDHADLHHSLAASPTLGCASCQGKCTLQNAKLYVVCKFKNGLTKLKKVATVLRDRRVFLSITLYMMLSFGVIVGQEVSIQQLIMVHAYIAANLKCLCLSLYRSQIIIATAIFTADGDKPCSWRIQYGWK